MTATAYLFPGQGVQSPEHGELVSDAAPDLLEVALELLGEDPFPRCGESTRFAQPAIVLASLASWRRLGAGDAIAFAGHSLGELPALAAAGAITQEEAVRLAVLRGELMAQAAERRPGGTMLAVLGGSPEQARELADDHGLVVANDNAPGQLVLAGPQAGVDGARRAARGRGLRAMELDVSGAFHSPQMLPARRAFAGALTEVAWRPASVPVFSGLTAAAFTDPVQELSAAVIAPVRWREVMLALRAFGAQRFVDVGPGDVLAKLVARNFKEPLNGVAVAA
jgi:[acyl-carrier-protein] S-malonyltransferase